MGQFDSIGLKPVGEIGLTKPQNRSSVGYTHTEEKPKPKPKPKATAGGGYNPPNKPPKGPTGGKNPKKGDDNEERQNKRRDDKLKKGKADYSNRENPRNAFKKKGE